MALNNFKLHHETDTHYTISHPNGKTLTVEKAGMNEKAKKLIASLNPIKMAKGGEVPMSSMNEDPNSPENNFGAGAEPVIPSASPMAGPMPTTVEGLPATMPAPTPQTPDMSAAAPQVSPMQKSLEAQKALNQQMVQGAEKLGKEESSLILNNEKEIAKIDTPQKTAQDYKVENDNLFKAYQSKTIDPDRYYKNMSTGSKITSAIGMLLSGFGSGVAKQQNMAAKILDDAVEQDIAAQKSDKDTAFNLWKANREKMQDDMSANLATKNQMYAGLKYKLDAAASRFKGQQAGMQAAQLNAALDQKIAENSMKLEALNPSKDVYKNEQNYSKRLIGLEMYYPEIAKEEKQKLIPGVGVAKVVPTDKDRAAISTSQQLKKDLTELQALATQGTTVPGSEADAVNQTKIASVKLKLKDAYQLGVLSGSDLEMLEKVVADPGAIRTQRAIKQLEATKKSMDGVLNSTYSKLGVTPFEDGNTKTMGGITYRKVTGGWEPVR
jgi:hypothetical protein